MNSIELSQQHADYIELIQITDTHIFASPDQEFDNVNTAKSLQQVITCAKNTSWPPDAVLVTGDLVHDTAGQAYENLAAILKTINLPVFCIPGNHDDPALMQKILNRDNISTMKLIHFNNWIIIMLDSFLPNTHAGKLHDMELMFLDEQLDKNKNKHALVCLHHHPVLIESPWMDNMRLENPDDFFAVLDKHPQVRAVIWGHIHQEFNNERNGVKLWAAPSTCVQFMPKTKRYTKDNKGPGYRVLKLYNTGNIESEIIRAKYY